MRSIVSLPLCLFLAIAPCLKAQQTRQLTRFEQTLLENEKAVNDVSADRGLDRWSDLVAADALAVYDSGFATKAEVISAIRSMRDVHYSMDDIKFIPISDSAGLIIYRMTQDGQTDEQRFHRQYYVSSLWLKRNGKWVSPFWQETDKATDSAAAAHTGDVAFFVAKEEEVWEALKHKDKSAATGLLAEDFLGMYDFGFYTKPEWIKQIDGQYTVDAYTIEDPKLLRPSPTTALLLYKSTCKGTGEWAEYCSHTQYISDLWVQRNGKWVDFFSQDTQAVRPATSASVSGSAESEKIAAGGSGAGEQNNKTLLDNIRGLEKSLWENAASPGPSASDRLLAEDLEIIKHGHRFTIAEEAKQFGDVHPASYTMEDIHAKVLSPDVFLLTYRAKVSWKGPYRGKEMASLPPQIIWVTSVWTRRERRWVNVLYEENPRDEFY